MTTKEARAMARYLNLKVNQPYIFAVMTGTGSALYGNYRDMLEVLTLTLSILDGAIQNLKKEMQPEAAEMFTKALQEYLAAEYVPEPKQLSGKELRKISRKNDEILRAIEKAYEEYYNEGK